MIGLLHGLDGDGGSSFPRILADAHGTRHLLLPFGPARVGSEIAWVRSGRGHRSDGDRFVGDPSPLERLTVAHSDREIGTMIAYSSLGNFLREITIMAKPLLPDPLWE